MSMFNNRFIACANIFVCVAISFAVLSGADDAETATFSDITMDLGIVVSDLERSIDFYTNVVGLERTGEFAVGADFCRDAGLTDSHDLKIQVLSPNGDSEGTGVKLMEVPDAKSAASDHSFIHSQLGFSYLTFFVNDIEAASARMKAAGVKASGKEQVRVPLETPVPMFLTLVPDPDGNLIELVGPKPSN